MARPWSLPVAPLSSDGKAAGPSKDSGFSCVEARRVHRALGGGINVSNSDVYIWDYRLWLVRRCNPVCDRFCDRDLCAESRRLRASSGPHRSPRRQFAFVDTLCRPAQRDGETALQAMADAFPLTSPRAKHICLTL